LPAMRNLKACLRSLSMQGLYLYLFAYCEHALDKRGRAQRDRHRLSTGMYL
jgi:hypothetical protein